MHVPQTFALLGVLLVAACVQKSRPAEAEGWGDHMDVIATTSQAKSGAQLSVALQPKDGWHLNTAYPGLKVSLSEKVPVGDKARVLKKADAHYEGEIPGNKADRARFEFALSAKLPAAQPVEGKFKAVICSADSCSPPFEAAFTVKPVAKAPDAPKTAAP